MGEVPVGEDYGIVPMGQQSRNNVHGHTALSIRTIFLLQIVSWDDDKLPKELIEVGNKIVRSCNGLPLSLKVLGSCLGGHKSLPNELANLSSFERLYLSSCSSLTSLPNELANLSSLERLYLSGCSSLTSLPNGLENLSSLKLLKLDKLAK
ncbi:uncharacterized protein [Physcomitrium patens]|uniref:uncharacterized protein n=1 Tax=Physcomitrium patens TaxID=3218 RepID=UPI003CCD6894